MKHRSTRRQFLKQSTLASASLALPSLWREGLAEDLRDAVEVNDVQSQLNATRVRRIVEPTKLDDVVEALTHARREGLAVTASGGRHAMGGQQFATDAVLLDLRRFNRVLNFDRVQGRIEVEAGIQWPELIAYLNRTQEGQRHQWTIKEKQSGVDRVTIAGSLAANIHGRGLAFPPIIKDVESFTLVDAQGAVHTCSRNENAELFSLAIGGYGLFGVITSVTLRLVPRTKVERVVEVIPVRDLLPWVDRRIESGFVYGDCQYSTDLETDASSHQGVFACYRPVDWDTPIPTTQNEMSDGQWAELYVLARTDKRKAFERYSQYYLSTSGQLDWSDTHQLAGNFDSYRKAVDVKHGTEMITEVYVPRENFVAAMAAARSDFLEHRVDMTYGTIRFIDRDDESFLAWAREPLVCIICNLHVTHTQEGKQKAADDFRRIIDRAIEFNGRYYLTYHRWATRKQVEACYPKFVDFLRLKKKYDPQDRFQSDWYRHYRAMFVG